MITLRILLALLCVICGVEASSAQTFPNKPVRLILWGPGSFPDIVARRMKEHLTVRWGQPVIVENRAGAGGLLAAAVGAQAPPDGHTLVWGDPVGWAFNQEGGKGASNAASQLVPVSLVVEVPMVVFVGANFPAKNLKELFAYAKAQSKPLQYASPGILSFHHLVLAHLAERAGVKMQHIPSRTISQISIDVASGDIAVSLTGIGSLTGFLNDGRLRALAWTGERRFDGLKDVPTVMEQGFADVPLSIKAGFFAHKATPPELVARLSRDLAEAARADDVVKFITGAGAIPAGSSPVEFTRAAAKDIELFSAVAERETVPK
jgi:tripartite-type tricarboxylate transporter receptor subunit TctC